MDLNGPSVYCLTGQPPVCMAAGGHKGSVNTGPPVSINVNKYLLTEVKNMYELIHENKN